MGKKDQDTSFPPCTPYHGNKMHLVHVDPPGTKLQFDKEGKPMLKELDQEDDDFSDIHYLEKRHVDCKTEPYIPQGYHDHIDPQSGTELPLCCQFHKSLFEEAESWYEIFPNCCNHHKEMAQEGWFDKSNYYFLPEKIVRQVDMTGFLIKERIDQPHWYDDITGYIDHNFTCFGEYGIGLNIYLGGLERLIEESRETIPADQAGRILNYINHVREFYIYSSDWYNNHPLMQHWLEVFPFDVEFIKHLKREFVLFETPLPFDRSIRMIKYGAVSFNNNYGSIAELTYKLTRFLLSKIKLSILQKEGSSLSKGNILIDLRLKQFDLKYTTYFENQTVQDPPYDYVGTLKDWFSDIIELINDIPDLKDALSEKSSSKISDKDLYSRNKRTIELVFSKIGNTDKGWEYAFIQESDYESYVQLLAKHFAGERYQLPDNKINLKRNAKTQVARALGTIHGELIEKKLKHDKEFFNIARVLKPMDEYLTDKQLYEAMVKEKIIFKPIK